MLLTTEERQKFIQWLEQNINSSVLIQTQFDKLNLPYEVINLLTAKEKRERTAYKIVLEVLQSIQENHVI